MLEKITGCRSHLAKARSCEKGKVDRFCVGYSGYELVWDRAAPVYPSIFNPLLHSPVAESKLTHDRGSVEGAFDCPCVRNVAS